MISIFAAQNGHTPDYHNDFALMYVDNYGSQLSEADDRLLCDVITRHPAVILLEYNLDDDKQSYCYNLGDI